MVRRHAPLERGHLVHEPQEAVAVLVLPVAPPHVQQEQVPHHTVVDPPVPGQARAEAREEPRGEEALSQGEVQGEVAVEERGRVQLLGAVHGQAVVRDGGLGQVLHEDRAVLQRARRRRR